jgi:uncharacterized protein (DUF4415 family)
MKKKSISKKLGGDPKRLSEMTDEDIDTSDIPEITPEQFARAIVRKGLRSPEPKAQITIRVDREVLDWFRAQGRGYYTRINTLLRAYMEAHR